MAADNSTNQDILGYYINPTATPISEIDFKALKSDGITDIYVLVTNDNYSSVLSQAQKKADAVGIRTHAWVYPGFCSCLVSGPDENRGSLRCGNVQYALLSFRNSEYEGGHPGSNFLPHG